MTTDLRTPDPADDGFHEIQLNGKQLVFLGMATTIVSVVIFLCGVLVGRGVRPVEPVTEVAAAGVVTPEAIVGGASPPAQAPVATAEEPEPVAEAEASAPAGPAASDATPAPSTPAAALAKPAPPAAKPAIPAAKPATPAAKPAQPATSEAEASAPRTEPAPPAAAPEARSAAATPPSASTTGTADAKIAVQVAALSNRGDAEAVARRLSSKGYAVYVVNPEPGAKAIFKVRVGNYASFDEAQRISTRLAEEEKLKPWIIR